MNHLARAIREIKKIKRDGKRLTPEYLCKAIGIISYGQADNIEGSYEDMAAEKYTEKSNCHTFGTQRDLRSLELVVN
ncbi:MAG: hypothetical protein HQK52_19075 [Oligoflexia bacterium]|nr:hypothetical protein [Oligoflexia bacterium]